MTILSVCSYVGVAMLDFENTVYYGFARPKGDNPICDRFYLKVHYFLEKDFV